MLCASSFFSSGYLTPRFPRHFLSFSFILFLAQLSEGALSTTPKQLEPLRYSLGWRGSQLCDLRIWVFSCRVFFQASLAAAFLYLHGGSISHRNQVAEKKEKEDIFQLPLPGPAFQNKGASQRTMIRAFLKRKTTKKKEKSKNFVQSEKKQKGIRGREKIEGRIRVRQTERRGKSSKAYILQETPTYGSDSLSLLLHVILLSGVKFLSSLPNPENKNIGA